MAMITSSTGGLIPECILAKDVLVSLMRNERNMGKNEIELMILGVSYWQVLS